MKYKVTFKWVTSEINLGEIIIEADSEEQALDDAQEIFDNGDIDEYIRETIPDYDAFDIVNTEKVEDE